MRQFQLDKRAAPNTKQIILPHHPQLALVIDVEVAPAQFGGNAAIAIARRFQGDLLRFIAYFHFDWNALVQQPRPIKSSPVESRHGTQRDHRFGFFRGLADFFKQASAPLTTAGG